MMCKIRQIFILGVFVLSFIALSSTAVKAQSVPEYLFLEVLDSNNKPVEGATVETPPNGFSSSGGGKQLTDEKGTTRFFLPYNSGYYAPTSYFTVSKDGYFTYHDFGGVSAYPPNSNAKIELLKIPQNKAAAS